MRLVLLFLSLFLSLSAAQAQGSQKIAWSLVLESTSPKPGESTSFALVGKSSPGWHAYWLNPGETGKAMRVSWSLPKGYSANGLSYPVPEVISIGGFVNYGYKSEHALLGRLSIPSSANERLTLSAQLNYLVCSESMCIPETANVSTVIVPGDGAADIGAPSQFAAWRSALPRGGMKSADIFFSNGKSEISVVLPGSAQGARFFPSVRDQLNPASKQTARREGDRLIISIDAKSLPSPLRGLIVVNGKGQEITAKAVAPSTSAASDAQTGIVPDADIALANAKTAGPSGLGSENSPAEAMVALPSAGSSSLADRGSDEEIIKDGPNPWGLPTILIAFLGAVLGGFILNAMPCVFPILSLKVLSLAKAGGDEASVKRDALAYTAGAMVTCIGLGVTIIVLRSIGHEAGWAFQLQDPRTIALLMMISGAIAFNLAGLYEIRLPIGLPASGGSFSTGALAAFVATPCTGPFMGAALGAALVLPVAASITVFAGLGLGIALPFLLVGFIPKLRSRLPRPGAWMNTLKKLMSLPMFLTALALAWLLGRQAGPDGIIIGLAALLILGIALWAAGIRQSSGKDAWRWALPGFAMAGALSLLVSPVALAAPEKNGVSAFSEEKLASLQSKGSPVFVYFTADWCVTCKVNERTLATKTVEDALRAGNVSVLVGDWTNGDEKLGRFIRKHGRAGVPLYLWYMPGSDEPQLLPQILTASLIVEKALPSATNKG